MKNGTSIIITLAVNVIKNFGNPIDDMIANKSRYFPFQNVLLPVIDFGICEPYL